MPDPMTEAQAEAALLALGPRLEWGQVSVLLYEAPPYRVHRYVAGCYFVSVNGVHAEGKMYRGLDAAKAACERHHATGKWD